MNIDVATSKGTLSGGLIGTWELLAREDRTHGGELRNEPSLGANPIALLFFDGHGNFAAQFMKRDRAKNPSVDVSGPISNNSRARDGYDAYFGTYHHVFHQVSALAANGELIRPKNTAPTTPQAGCLTEGWDPLTG